MISVSWIICEAQRLIQSNFLHNTGGEIISFNFLHIKSLSSTSFRDSKKMNYQSAFSAGINVKKQFKKKKNQFQWCFAFGFFFFAKMRYYKKKKN